MKKTAGLKIFFQLMKGTLILKAIYAYIIAFLIISAIMTVTEPSITNYFDGMWYAFVSSSTIGFGDFAAATLFGRISTVILYILTILILALITAFFTQFFTELVKSRQDESVVMIQHDIEHLEDLPKERLAEISKKIRESRGR